MPPSTLRVAWLAFTASQLVLAAVGWTVWSGLDPEAAPVVWLLCALVAPASVLSVLGHRLVPRTAEPMVGFLIRWAGAETCSLLGLVAALVGGPRWLPLVAAGWAGILLLLAAPGTDLQTPQSPTGR